MDADSGMEGRTTDVVVVGAGPAGSSAARRLSESGFSVIVLDSKMEIGAPVICADLVNLGLPGLHDLREDPRIMLNKPEKVNLVSGKSALHFYPSYGEGDAFNSVVERDRLDKELMSRAVQSGSRIKIRSEFLGTTEEKGLVGVKYREGGKTERLATKYVILATGASVSSDNSPNSGKYRYDYRRFISGNGTDPTIEVGDSLSMTYRVPRGTGNMNGVLVRGADISEIPERFQGSAGKEIISGNREVSLLHKPYAGSGRTLYAGTAGGFFDQFFLSGFREALITGNLCAEAIMASEESGAEPVSELNSLLSKKVLRDMQEQLTLRGLLRNSSLEKIRELFSVLSQYEYHEVSVKELITTSGLKLKDMAEILGQVH